MCLALAQPDTVAPNRGARDLFNSKVDRSETHIQHISLRTVAGPEHCRASVKGLGCRDGAAHASAELIYRPDLANSYQRVAAFDPPGVNLGMRYRETPPVQIRENGTAFEGLGTR